MAKVLCSICGGYYPVGALGDKHRSNHLKYDHRIPYSPGFVAFWFLDPSEYVDDTILIHCKKNLSHQPTEIIFSAISYTGVRENEIFWFDQGTLLYVLQKLRDMGLICQKDGWILPTSLGRQVQDYMRASVD